MKDQTKRSPVLLILFFLIAIGIVVFMMFVVHTNAKIVGSPGKTSVCSIICAILSESAAIWMNFRLQRILDPTLKRSLS